MARYLLSTFAVAMVAWPALAKVVAPPPPAMRALSASVVVVGKVSKIEHETLSVKPTTELEPPQEYSVALVKIQDGLIGAEGLTHLKVAFPVRSNRLRLSSVPLQEGQEVILFLEKHSVGGFLTYDYFSPPVDLKSPEGREALARVNRVANAITKPKEALASKEARERTFAAAVQIMKLRGRPVPFTVKEELLPLEESQTLLKALAETDWTSMGEDVDAAWRAFTVLPLGAEDGFRDIKVPPGGNHLDTVQSHFRDWLKGSGKNYRISRVLSKT